MGIAPSGLLLCDLSSAKPSVRQATDEIDERGADLAWALLLGPVSAAGQNSHATQRRDELPEIGEMLVDAGGSSHHHVMVARDKERRDLDRDACKRRHQLPIAVEVAIIVERTAEAAAPEFAGIEIDVRIGEPCRQHRRQYRFPQPATVARHHAGGSCFIAAGYGCAVCRGAFTR